MRKSLIVLLLWLGMLAGCNGEPSYRGLSFITYNYTPWDLDSIEITDSEGNSASTGSIGAGGGEGSVTCCYKLKGTDFKVRWRGVDGEEAIKHLDDGTLDEVVFNKETPVHFPASAIPAGDGPLYLELHIYPDEHMEMALSRKLLGQVRIPIVDTTRWLYLQHRDVLQDYRDSSEVRRVLAKVAKTAWLKYGIEDKQDMRQYMYLYFTVASNFDADPEIAAVLARPGRQPGDFAQAVESMSEEKIARLKAAGTAPGDKNG
ncbi:MAG: hypothetical protein ACN6PJ_04740 [Achromobacter sp.]|uniref:hypothetical protein n=1 Tax=Achromobacter sp. TaxID=134375 RepID=UPI003CFEFCAF